MAKTEIHPDCALFLLDPAAVRRLDPAELYGDLFRRVQTEGLFTDSKYFVDMLPRSAPAHVMSSYLAHTPTTPEQLKQFVETQFLPPEAPDLSPFKKRTGLDLNGYISALWPALTRNSSETPVLGSSLIAVDGKYLAPGGRFREIYYWDSYITQLGMIPDGQIEVADNMVRIFEKMLLREGRIFNGNRTYYRARSQPPLFAFMVSLWRERYGAASAAQFLPALQTEYAFWMSGAEHLQPGEANARVIRLPDGSYLNRYWNDKATPRPEAYKEDLALATEAARLLGRKPEEVFRDLAAAAESGWDFSTRWFADPLLFATIQTTALLPVDLNSFLWFLENQIAELSAIKGDTRTAARFQAAATQRARLIQNYMYDESGIYFDFNWKTSQRSSQLTIAMVAPLFVGIANQAQADKVLALVEKQFLKPGGVRTTLLNSGQQWDGDNGWAPCQWMAYVAAVRYGHLTLANQIRLNWLAADNAVFAMTGELAEKNNVVNPKRLAHGGEYAPQFGFGWTAGVHRAFMDPSRALFHLLSPINPIAQ